MCHGGDQFPRLRRDHRVYLGNTDMSNFITWWLFNMRPENDGSADDTAADGAGATRWGWTFPTWRIAMTYTKQTPSLAAFGAMTQAQAGLLAQVYFWNRFGGPGLAAGADVMVIDWIWNTGVLAAFIIQENVGGLEVDGDIGPKTIAAINDMGATAFVNDCYNWRIAFLDSRGFRDVFPGLYTRSLNCKTLALGLIGGS